MIFFAINDIIYAVQRDKIMGLRSIREIYVIGHGPSSSHTMGPYFASQAIVNKYKDKGIKSIEVTLYGSLALTGRGHLTDKIVELALKDYTHQVLFDLKTKKKHPNTMVFKVVTQNKTYKETVVSIGGGSILTSDNKQDLIKSEIYPHQYMDDIVNYCKKNKLSFYDYIKKYEDDSLEKYMKKVLKTMDEAVERGLLAEGYLPGELKVKRKAKKMYEAMEETDLGLNDVAMNVAIHSFAVAEENAAGGIIVTAPTCGSAGVIPGCVKYLRMKKVIDENIIKGLAVAALFGMVCKTNASVSGAEAGCQAEIGVACAMGAAMIAFAKDMGNRKAAEAAEIALEHSLGLTCDPVKGYVQIPCIERCAMYALKAKNAVSLVKLIPYSSQVISFDDSVKTMYATGKDLACGYRETGEKGLGSLKKF